MSENKRILVIDDEQDFCRMMVEMLTAAGYRVDSAEHPILAAEQALSGDYDLITLDLNLEEFNGKDVWDLYRDQNINIPVVVISGYLNNEAREDLKESGIEFTLEKPFRKARLLEVVETALAN
jgi:two-component system, LuxR family, response regulator FixJ